MELSYEVSNTVIYVANSDSKFKSNVALRKKDFAIYFDSSYNQKWFKSILDQTEDMYKYMVISHAHEDHYKGMLGGACQLKKIFCSEDMAEILLLNNFTRNNLVILNNDNSNLDIDGVSLIFCSHCHTKGDIYLIDIDNKIAFLGDLYIQNRHPLIENKYLTNLHMCLEKVFSMDIDMFIPGHGIPSNRTEFKKYLDYLKLLMDGIISHVHEARCNNG